MFDLLGIKVLGRKLKDKMISANADPSLDRVESAPPIDPPPPDEVPPEEADTEEEEEEEDVDEDEKRDELKELNSGGELGQLTRNGSSITGQVRGYKTKKEKEMKRDFMKDNACTQTVSTVCNFLVRNFPNIKLLQFPHHN